MISAFIVGDPWKFMCCRLNYLVLKGGEVIDWLAFYLTAQFEITIPISYQAAFVNLIMAQNISDKVLLYPCTKYNSSNHYL
jgi:hypothetical protein